MRVGINKFLRIDVPSRRRPLSAEAPAVELDLPTFVAEVPPGLSSFGFTKGEAPPSRNGCTVPIVMEISHVQDGQPQHSVPATQQPSTDRAVRPEIPARPERLEAGIASTERLRKVPFAPILFFNRPNFVDSVHLFWTASPCPAGNHSSLALSWLQMNRLTASNTVVLHQVAQHRSLVTYDILNAVLTLVKQTAFRAASFPAMV